MGEDTKQPESKEELQKIINEITRYAIVLYDLMKPGMNIEVSFPEVQAIIVPNRPPQMRCLLISRPAMNVKITAQINKSSSA